MKKNDILTIHVKISGFSRKFNIPREDEEMYRNAEKKLDKVLTHYQQKYNLLSSEEILSLVAYLFAKEVCMKELKEDVDPTIERLKALDEELDKVLSE